jgi:hypothetical protein
MRGGEKRAVGEGAKPGCGTALHFTASPEVLGSGDARVLDERLCDSELACIERGGAAR